MTSKFLTTVLLLGAFAGCYASAADPSAAPPTAAPGTTQASAGDTGLPCDVQKVLAENCWTCHGTTPAQDAPMSLVSYDDLSATNADGDTYADLAVARMRDAKSPMPPSGSMAEADIAVVEAWVNAGAHEGVCGDATGDLDVYATPSVCTSKATWKSKDHGSPLMHPGGACIDCHSGERDAPEFSLAGTVFPTAHEPIDCNGKAGVSVVITDAKGKTHKLKTNAAGNFYLETSIPTPYTAKLVSSDGKTERAMNDAQTSGDCNGCHTEEGTHTKSGTDDAPGRIMAP
jgi:hypothetical protein